MPEMKTLNGYEVVDAKAREDITGLRNDLPTKVSQLQNDSKFITRDEVPEQDLSEYITENELLAKGYLTEHQDISGKADKVHSHPEYLTEHQDLSEYAKKNEIPDISGKADKEHTHPEYLTEHQSLEDYAKKSEIPDVSDFISEIPSEYITESELEAKGYLTEHQSLEGYATEAYVDENIDNVKLHILDMYKCYKLTDTQWTLTDNVKNILRKLFNGERFPIAIETSAQVLYIPSRITISSEKIEIRLDTSHNYTGDELASLSQDIYIFSNAEGALRVITNTLNIADSYEYQRQLAALEARIAALEGGTN